MILPFPMSSTSAQAPALACPRTGTATRHDRRNERQLYNFAQNSQRCVYLCKKKGRPPDRARAGGLTNSNAAGAARFRDALRRATRPAQEENRCAKELYTFPSRTRQGHADREADAGATASDSESIRKLAAPANRSHPAVALYAKYHASACLLYTSPSPRDQRGSRMPSSA